MAEPVASDSDGPQVVHASCVAIGPRAALILGASGSGKSALALSLMAYGAKLVADDRVILTRHDMEIRASAPTPLQGLIEARGVGLLTCVPVQDVAVRLVIDMDRTETDRFPDLRSRSLLGLPVPELRRVEAGHFAAAVLQFLRSGRREPS